jgi:hypothetical protein
MTDAEIIDEFNKLEKISGAIFGLDDIIKKITPLGYSQQKLNNLGNMLEDWKKTYWYGSLDAVNWNELCIKVKDIQKQLKTKNI